MENKMESDTQVSYSAVAFDFEQSLWDNVVLELIRSGYSADKAAAHASIVITQRRVMFNNNEQGD